MEQPSNYKSLPTQQSLFFFNLNNFFYVELNSFYYKCEYSITLVLILLILILTNIVLSGWIWSFSVAFFAKTALAQCSLQDLSALDELSVLLYGCFAVILFGILVGAIALANFGEESRDSFPQFLSFVFDNFCLLLFGRTFVFPHQKFKGVMPPISTKRNIVNYIQCCHGNLFIRSIFAVETLFSVFM